MKRAAAAAAGHGVRCARHTHAGDNYRSRHWQPVAKSARPPLAGFVNMTKPVDYTMTAPAELGGAPELASPERPAAISIQCEHIYTGAWFVSPAPGPHLSVDGCATKRVYRLRYRDGRSLGRRLGGSASSASAGPFISASKHHHPSVDALHFSGEACTGQGQGALGRDPADKRACQDAYSAAVLTTIT